MADPKSDYDLGAALTGFALDSMFKGGTPNLKGLDFDQPESRLIHPEMGVRSKGEGRPEISGSLTAPLGTNDVSLEGSYQKRSSRDPTDWGVGVKFNRKF